MKKNLSQEALKVLACVTMFLDHFGAMCTPATDVAFFQMISARGMLFISVEMYYILRCIGRLAFPIYCFLLAEGAHYTRNPKNYAIRLGIGMLLAEVPFDCAFFGGFTWEHQSVMVTLLLGFVAIRLMKKTDNLLLKVIVVAPFVLAAEWLRTDYGGHGVAMMAMFALTRDLPYARLWQLGGLLVINGMMKGATLQYLLGIPLPIQVLASFAMVPIVFYSGKKATSNKFIQWGFYLFYPVHIALLALILG